MGTVSETRPLLEREAELSRIGSLLEAVADGPGGLLLVEGPAGIGKTRLLEAAAERAGAAGTRVLHGRGTELERELAHGVVRQLFEPALMAVEDAARARLLAGAARHAAPALALEGTGAQGSDDAYAVLHGLYWLAVGLCEHREPLLLIVDDAHWADAPSLRFLDYLAGRLRELPLAVIVAARAHEPGADPKLLARLATGPHAGLLRPKALSRDATETLVAGGLGAAPDADFVDACQRLTEGSPYLLGELIRSCAEDRLAPRAAAAARLAELVPGTVAHSTLLRLGRLPAGASRLARAVGVLDPAAELRHAARLAGLGETEAAEAADLLARADILRPGRPLGFKHPLVRAAVYADTPEAERRRWHAGAAILLRADGAQPQQLAVHLLLAEPRGDEDVVATLREAAHHAAAGGGADVAVEYLRRALAEPPTPELRPRLLLEAGTAEARAGDPRAPEHLEQALRTAREGTERVLAAVTLGRTLLVSDQPSEAMATFERALATLGRDDDARLLFEGAVVGAAMLDSETAPLVAERLERLRREVETRDGAPFNLLAVLAMQTAITNGAPQRAIQLARRALQREGPLADAAGRAPFFYHACAALLWSERYEEVRAHYEGWLAMARTLGSAQQFAATSCFLSWLELRCGEVAAAEAHARAALDAEALHSQALFRPIILGKLLAALAERGNLDEAEAELTGAALEERSSLHYAIFLYERGVLRLAQDRPAEALDDLLESGRRLLKVGARSPCVVPWRSTAALAQLRLGERTEAVRLAGEELELARSFGTSTSIGVALRAAGLATEGEPGIALLREAAATLEGTVGRLDHARALTELGAALRRSKRRVEAREHLRLALDGALRCGATALAERARTELLATGARPRRVVLSGTEALTPSERRIAEMAAEGMTNREIAQALFVTPRTVEGHLTSVYRKLEIETREQLPEALGN